MNVRESRSIFAAEYLKTMDLEQAAKKAGLSPQPELLEKYREDLNRTRIVLGGQVTGEDVLRRLVRLGFGTGRECAALLEGSWEEKGLDLSLVSEVKRGSNGTVEFKLIDRVSVLEKLLELMKSEEDGAESFLKALQNDEGGEMA